MERGKIGIATVYTGYNYGSSLQAYATKIILRNMGYRGELLKMDGSLIPGRDVRLGKLLITALRSLMHTGSLKSLKNYRQSMAKELSDVSVRKFGEFTQQALTPRLISGRALKKAAHGDEYKAFVCGSDQIWNSEVFYVDPFYYLRFAPVSKRIAFAPSFGRDFVPDYNKKLIARYVSDIPCKSVREHSGAGLIRELTGEEAQVLIDPTLVLNAEEWTQTLGLDESAGTEKYLLAYFLDKPSKKAEETVLAIARKFGLKIVGLPYRFENCPWENAAGAGPKEFVEYVRNAAMVCTDSFHGTAFSLNFNVPFYTFNRNYGSAGEQSARIRSILELTGMTARYEPTNIETCMNPDFGHVNEVLAQEREKAHTYLSAALNREEK